MTAKLTSSHDPEELMKDPGETHAVICALRQRASRVSAQGRPTLKRGEASCLLANWKTAEDAGVRFDGDGISFHGVRFRLPLQR